MMADAVEARSRSLSIYTEESINTAVEQMIDLQIADGQFKDAPISFRDVETVKSVFKERLKYIPYKNCIPRSKQQIKLGGVLKIFMLSEIRRIWGCLLLF